MALPGVLRLKKNSDFKTVFTEGRFVSGRFLKLFYRPNQLLYNRIGCSIQKAKLKNLVQKNRLQRLIKEACLKNLNIIQGYDLVWVLQERKIILPTFRDVEDEVSSLLKRIV